MNQALGVSKQSVYELLRERRAVSPEMALRLARLFGNSPAFWLNLQRSGDLFDAQAAIEDDVQRIEPLLVAGSAMRRARLTRRVVTSRERGSPMCSLSVDEALVPCPVDDGDELFPNGIVVFNFTRILEHVERHPAEVARVQVAVSDFPRWDRALDDAHVEATDLARPVVLAEISPGNYHLIDGHHRMEEARRSGLDTLQASS